ncbi:transposase, partial [Synechococcus sp. H60.1]
MIAVPPEYSSQECPGCGYLVKQTLSTRSHRCPKCGLVLCRDANAALNILRRALRMTVGHRGTAGPPFHPPVYGGTEGGVC